MLYIKNFSYFLIGFSYSFLLINKIYFGISLLTGILLMMALNKVSKIHFYFSKTNTNLFFLFFLISISLSTLNSIIINRSVAVELYLIIFIFFGLNIFFFFKENPIVFKKVENFLIISIIVNISIIFLYNLSSEDYELFGSVKKFKGYLNIISILVLLLTFFKNKNIFFIPIFILLPSLYYSDSNSPFLGILIGIIGCFLYYLCVKFSPKKIFLILITLVIFFSHQTFKSLPKHFDESSIQEFEFKIPTSLVDIHRQFIWGFSLSKFFEKPLLGFGPDTSNFIEGGQKEIGHTHTGDMTFIPSHPHNFLVELLLELGIVGTISFLLFIFFLNTEIFKKADLRQKYYLIFFNFYFWGASLVNFSFWLGWWQGSYFLILSLMASKIFINNKNFSY